MEPQLSSIHFALGRDIFFVLMFVVEHLNILQKGHKQDCLSIDPASVVALGVEHLSPPSDLKCFLQKLKSSRRFCAQEGGMQRLHNLSALPGQ